MFTYAGISTRGPYAGLGFRHHRKSRRHSSSATNIVGAAARYIEAKQNLAAANVRLATASEAVQYSTHTYADRQRALSILKAKNA